jgi:predicted membrane protein
MEEKEMETDHEVWSKMEKEHRRGKIFGGVLIVFAGSLFLAKELGAEIPQWIFTWKMFLIALGLIIGVKHKFMHPGWLILVLIGGAFLACDLYPGITLKPVLWPVLVILFGLFIIFKPRRKHKERYWKKWQKHHGRHHSHYRNECCMEASDSSEEVLDDTTFMGGIKKNILTKNFKGGEVVAVFGGTELNLLQADFENTATLEITCVFAGVKLIVPANWEVNSELVSAFGSVEDKRPVQPKTEGPVKTLVLKGTVFFGGIDIRNY